MDKNLINEIRRIKELSNINDTKDISLNENILDDIGNFLSKASETISKLPAVKKLKDFYNKMKSSVGVDSSPEISSISDIDSTFKEITKKIIDKLEGGYYHPSFKIKGAKNVNGGNMSPSSFTPMGRSGETMFGIDREHGGKLNTTSFGSEFWNIIDSAQRIEGKWPYNYKGGSHKDALTDLVIKMMFNQYQTNANNFLSKESKKIIESDKNLFFQFVYATWNGTGYFQKLANEVNKEVKNGNTNPLDLYDIVIDARHNSGQSSKKIAKIDTVIHSYA